MALYHWAVSLFMANRGNATTLRTRATPTSHSTSTAGCTIGTAYLEIISFVPQGGQCQQEGDFDTLIQFGGDWKKLEALEIRLWVVAMQAMALTTSDSTVNLAGFDG